MRIVFFGLSLSSSWGNGHAVTYRGLLRALKKRGHSIQFFERDTEWYAAHRDLAAPDFAELVLYTGWREVALIARDAMRDADAIIVGSYFPDAVQTLKDALGAGRAVVAFYDIDTPVTLGNLRLGKSTYIEPELIPELDLYLSFTGGPVLQELMTTWKARRALPLYCACDESQYLPAPKGHDRTCALTYMGTYAPDRVAKFERLFLEVARRLPERRFRAAGPMHPGTDRWPGNIAYQPHVAPGEHLAFYHSGCFTLNLTRQAMAETGYSPSIRLFEAAACGTPIVSDAWPGIGEFFTHGTEILVVQDAGEVTRLLCEMSPEEAASIAAAARERVLSVHTSTIRAGQLEGYLVRSATAIRTSA